MLAQIDYILAQITLENSIITTFNQVEICIYFSFQQTRGGTCMHEGVVRLGNTMPIYDDIQFVQRSPMNETHTVLIKGNIELPLTLIFNRNWVQ